MTVVIMKNVCARKAVCPIGKEKSALLSVYLNGTNRSRTVFHSHGEWRTVHEWDEQLEEFFLRQVVKISKQ